VSASAALPACSVLISCCLAAGHTHGDLAANWLARLPVLAPAAFASPLNTCSLPRWDGFSPPRSAPLRLHAL
jgi:hypothetical protein